MLIYLCVNTRTTLFIYLFIIIINFENTKYFYHTQKEEIIVFKEIYSGVYLKGFEHKNNLFPRKN